MMANAGTGESAERDGSADVVDILVVLAGVSQRFCSETSNMGGRA